MKSKLLLLAAALAAVPASAQVSTTSLHLIPEPKLVELLPGRFTLTGATKIRVGSARDKEAAATLAEDIAAATGRRPDVVVSDQPQPPEISLSRQEDSERPQDPKAGALWQEQGYRLEADADGIRVSAPTPEGLFYGAQTLRQLLVPRGRSLSCPALYITDWPSLKWRGVHVDLSRGPIASLDYMKKQVRMLAEYKVNLYALYMERVFDYPSQPLLKHPDGGLTAAELRELIDYARRFHVTILPEQQAFGHLHHVLQYEAYNALAETPHGHVLAPVEAGSYDLIKQLYADIAPVFPGPFFHVGADETFELGTGRSQQQARKSGLGPMYLEHLKKVYEIMKPYHKRLLFWGDIAVKYPDLLGVLPKDMIAVPWNYDLDTDNEALIKPFKAAGLEFMVSPGASNWNRIWPDLDIAFANVKDFARAGQKFGALGLLNTTWNDDGEALIDMAWPALALGAAASWQPAVSTDTFLASYDWAFYRNQDGSLRQALESLDRCHQLLRGAGLPDGAGNAAFWLDPFSPAGSAFSRKALPVARELRLAAEKALVALQQDRAHPLHHAGTLNAMTVAAMRLDALGMKLQFADEIARFYKDAYSHRRDHDRVMRDLYEITDTNGRLEDLRDETTRLKRFYSDSWLEQYRPYWLGNVQVQYDGLAGLYQAKILAVRAARDEFDAHGKLPPPEKLGIPD